jgi:RHS repeat-associated protein
LGSAIYKSGINGSINSRVTYDILDNITYKNDVGNYYYPQSGKGPHSLAFIDNSTADSCVYTFNELLSYTSYNYTSSIIKGFNQIIFTYGPERNREQMTTEKFGRRVQTKNYYGDLYEEVINTKGDTSYVYYIKANNEIIAIGYGPKKYAAKKDSINYVLKDHLGSVYAYLDEVGKVREYLSTNVYGQPRDPKTWKVYSVPQGQPSFDRNFTFHESIDLDFLINMNGRIFNPVLGRFLTPDPFIQFPDNLMSYNRYSYVLNNPVNYFDPSGFFSLKKLFKRIAPIVIGAVIGYYTFGFGIIGSGAAAGFGSGFSAGILNGQSFGNAFQIGLKSAIQGGFTKPFLTFWIFTQMQILNIPVGKNLQVSLPIAL